MGTASHKHERRVVKIVEDTVAQHGARIVERGRTARAHSFILIELDRQRRKFVFAVSGDWRAERNTQSALRQVLRSMGATQHG